MNMILNLFKPESLQINLKGNQDPVPSFIDKLSSGENLKIKIQSNTDNLLIQTKKNLTVLSSHISPMKNFPNSQKLKDVYLCFQINAPRIFLQENRNLY